MIRRGRGKKRESWRDEFRALKLGVAREKHRREYINGRRKDD